MPDIRIEFADFFRFRRTTDVNAYYNPGDPAFDQIIENPLAFAIVNFRVHVDRDSFFVRVLIDTKDLDEKWLISRAKEKARNMLLLASQSPNWGYSD
jgi:hypothetical protein